MADATFRYSPNPAVGFAKLSGEILKSEKGSLSSSGSGAEALKAVNYGRIFTAGLTIGAVAFWG